MNQTIRFHIQEHTVTVVHSPVRTWNVRRVRLHRLRFKAVEACQFVKQIHKVQVILCFQNLNTLGRSTRRETKGRMMEMTPAAPSVARSSQTLTSEYLHNKSNFVSDSVTIKKTSQRKWHFCEPASKQKSRSLPPYCRVDFNTWKFISCRSCIAICFNRSWLFCR